MGRHRAPDPDEPTGEPSDDYPEPHDFAGLGDHRDASDDDSDEIADGSGYFDYTDPPERDAHGEQDLPPDDVETPDDFPEFARSEPEPPAAPPPGGHRGLGDWRGGHRSDGG